MLAALSLALIVAGCRDARLSEVDPNDGAVRTVSAYDITLGPDASPEDVVYVLLRAIHDHVKAAQAGDRAAVRAAQKIERSVAAPKRIYELLHTSIPESALPSNLTRAQAVYFETKSWAPVAAHYAEDLHMTREQAESRMREVNRPPDVRVVHIDLENEEDHRHATLAISCAKEDGYWRVFKVAYSPMSVARMARPTGGSTSQPTTGAG